MKRTLNWISNFPTRLRVGFFLAVRQVRRSNKWTTVLIIFVMTLTFLNLVVVTGILVGLVEGIGQSVRQHYTGDITITRLDQNRHIEHSAGIILAARSLPEVESVTGRYVEGANLEANYKTKKTDDLPNSAGAIAAGIDPEQENKTTALSSLIIAGNYLSPSDYDQVLVGYSLLSKYFEVESSGFPTLDNVDVGSKIRVKVGDVTREVTIKGVMKSKVDEVDRRIFFVGNQLRSMANRIDNNVDEIAIKLKPGVDPILAKQKLIVRGFGEGAKIQTYEEGEPKFVTDIKNTFNMLGNAISSIGLVVACITIFIVIFINAITRRKFIGILKGIGIESGAIEIAYILQSLFYVLFGTLIGMIIVFGFLKPFFSAHPINFPFSDGILVATIPGTLIRALILFVATYIAGYIPAKIVVRQNTLDAILGR